MWVLSTLPLGCLPSTRTLQGGLPFRPCSDKLNNESVYFNSKLEEKISTLKNQTNLPNFDVRFIDVYNPILELMQNAASKGHFHFSMLCYFILNVSEIFFINMLLL